MIITTIDDKVKKQKNLLILEQFKVVLRHFQDSDKKY